MAGRRDWLWLAMALAVAALCVRLGVWQLKRLGQRRARNAVAQAALARPPIELLPGTSAESLPARRVYAHGVYDYTHEQMWRPRTFADEPGVDLITPLRLADGRAVLVDRGFVASPDAYHVDAGAYREPDTADVVGLALVAPRGHGDVDPVVVQGSVPYPLLGVVLQVLPIEGAPPLPGVPERWPAPELTNGPHLSYAIQWFSFAIIIAVGSLALVRRGSPR
jgi:surfeit locus 1 family protein